MSDYDAFAESSPATAPPAAQPVAHLIVSRERAGLSREIGLGRHARVEALGAGARIALYLPDDAMDAHSSGWSDGMVLSGSFGSIEIAQAARFLRACTGIDLAHERVEEGERWSWITAAVIGRLRGTPFAGAERIEPSGRRRGGEGQLLRLQLHSGEHAINTVARASADSWISLLEAAAWTRKQRPYGEHFALPIRVPVRLARHTLPVGILRSLAAGDIILPDAPRFTCEGEGLVGIGRVLLRVRYGVPSSLKIIELGENVEPDELEDEAMDEAMDEVLDEVMGEVAHEVADAAGGDLLQDAMPLQDEVIDSTPLTLDFQLGHLELTLGALRTLTAGVILPVEGGMPASVAVTCGRRVIGRGEIVDVDGQLGIRITEWGTP